MFRFYRFHKNIFSIPINIPIKERYECIDFIHKTNKVNNIIIKRTNFQISDTFKNIPLRERYETIDF
jgi:hypothetical protein